MSNDVVYEKVVSAQIKNLNSGSASEFPDTFNEISVASVQELFSKLTVCRLGETRHLFFCNSLFIFIIKWQN